MADSAKVSPDPSRSSFASESESGEELGSRQSRRGWIGEMVLRRLCAKLDETPSVPTVGGKKTHVNRLIST